MDGFLENQFLGRELLDDVRRLLSDLVQDSEKEEELVKEIEEFRNRVVGKYRDPDDCPCPYGEETEVEEEIDVAPLLESLMEALTEGDEG